MAVEVEAAGGVVFRTAGAHIEVLVVHRPQYDDWSLPKGKLETGETFEAAAVREVEEETGWRCRLDRELTSMHYVDRRGHAKTVRWWTMQPVDQGEWTPNDEVDAVRWISLHEAETLLTYAGDCRLLDEAVATETPTEPLGGTG